MSNVDSLSLDETYPGVWKTIQKRVAPSSLCWKKFLLILSTTTRQSTSKEASLRPTSLTQQIGSKRPNASASIDWMQPRAQKVFAKNKLTFIIPNTITHAIPLLIRIHSCIDIVLELPFYGFYQRNLSPQFYFAAANFFW